MQKFLWILFVCVLQIRAQDTIRFRSGEIQAVKVNEVGVSDVKYSKFDNLTGPLYVILKNDIKFIKYYGGQVDTFETIAPEIKPVEFKAAAIVGTDKIIIGRNKLVYRGRALGESRLGKLVNQHPDNEKRNAMMRPYMEMKQHRTKQYVFGFVGLGIGLIAPYIGMVSGFIFNDYTPFAVGVAIGAGVGITGAVLSSINKHKRNQKKLETARIYNQ